MVLQASDPQDTKSRRALEELCKASWHPIYAFVRRLGYNQDDAEDLAQGFFEHVLTNNVFASADKERGRFRSFLLGSLRHFVSNEARKNRAEKRGGKVHFVSMNADEDDDKYVGEIAHPDTPEKVFQRTWAEQLLKRTLLGLRADYERSNKVGLFDALQPYLDSGANPSSYQELAKTLGMSSGTVAVAVFRMRRRYGELLRHEIAQTVDNPADIEHEIRVLLSAVAA